MKVVYAGGGTGGHVYPALAIDDALRASLAGDLERRFIGSRRGLEARLVGDRIPMRFVPAAPLARSLSLSTLATVAVNGAGVVRALAHLLAFRPNVVVATGGYVCFPVALAARLLRLLGASRAAIALLEINAQPGLTNRLLRPLVDEVWLAYGASRTAFGSRGVVTGAPTRASLHDLPPQDAARERLGLRPDARVILAFGGSQGARSINASIAALANAPDFPGDWQILHVCGERDYAETERAYAQTPPSRFRVFPYLADPAPAYAAADVAVARSGASTLAELAVSATPAILIPYPHAGAHQDANARVFAGADAAVVIADGDVDARTLRTAIERALEPATNRAMRAAIGRLGAADAARTIAARVIDLAQSRVKPRGAAKASSLHE